MQFTHKNTLDSKKREGQVCVLLNTPKSSFIKNAYEKNMFCQNTEDMSLAFQLLKMLVLSSKGTVPSDGLHKILRVTFFKHLYLLDQ